MKTTARRLCIAAVAIALAGCTEERAVALKTAADAFSDKAVAAIDAVVDLHLRGLLGKQAAEEALIKKTQHDLLLTQKMQPASLDSVIGNSFLWVDEREKLRQTAFADYDRLKTAYVEFATAYHRLPEGSLLAAKDVSCSAALGTRLVKTMADAAKQLAARPVSLIFEVGYSKTALATGATTAAKGGGDEGLSDAVRSHVALLASDVAEAQRLRQAINTAADNQQTIQALIDLASLLGKFAH